MQIKLVVVEGAASRGEVQLRLPAVIGRSKEANLTIGHPKVSRRHCELYEEAGRLMVRDQGSLNGTLLDGNRVNQAAVAPGAKLTIGPLTFIALFESPAAAQQQSVPVIAVDQHLDEHADEYPDEHADKQADKPSHAVRDFSPGPDTDAAGFDAEIDFGTDPADPENADEQALNPAASNPTVAWQRAETDTDDETAERRPHDSALEVDEDDLAAFLKDLGR